MIKKLVLLFIALTAIQSYAQENTASPYSFYGIGSVKFKGSVENRSMGGLSIYKDSIHVNFKNPATYGGSNIEFYENESRPVKFTVGGSHTETELESQTGTDNVNSTSFDYLALAVPVGKLGFGFGLMPYTSVGYRLETQNASNNLDTRTKGEGGLNKAFLAFGYQVTKDFSVGVDANYNFGNIQKSAIQFNYDSNGDLLQVQSIENNRSDLSGLNFNLGLHYKRNITANLELQSSFTFSPASDLMSKNTRSFSVISVDATTGAESSPINTIESDLAASNLDETSLVLPSTVSFGAGLGESKKWFAGVEYTSRKMSEFSNPLEQSTAATYEDANTLSIGGFYIPKHNSYPKYWKRMVYRGGLRFENTGLKIKDESIKEFGIAFGLGLPVGTLRNPFSNVNLGFEFGQRGTTNANLIKENFMNFQLSLSLNDRWFAKRKYD